MKSKMGLARRHISYLAMKGVGFTYLWVGPSLNGHANGNPDIGADVVTTIIVHSLIRCLTRGSLGNRFALIWCWAL